MIGALLFVGIVAAGMTGAGLFATGLLLAAKAANPPPRCPECGEVHADPMDDCLSGPVSLRGEDLRRRGVGQGTSGESGT
jgi:hypothetical protein